MKTSPNIFPTIDETDEAKYRVLLKRGIRQALGIHSDSPLARGLVNASTFELEKLYKENCGSLPDKGWKHLRCFPIDNLTRTC